MRGSIRGLHVAYSGTSRNRDGINVSSATDEDRAIATITMAFSRDPVARWFLPDANRYLTYWPQVLRAFGGPAFAKGTADSIDDYGGVALWLPPGVAPDEETMGAITAEAIPAAVNTRFRGDRRAPCAATNRGQASC